MTSLVASIVDRVQSAVDPDYRQQKAEMRQYVLVGEGVALAALVCSVAFAVLGISLCSSGGLAIIAGLSICLVSLPLCYFTYNSFRTIDNMRDIANNPKKYQCVLGLDDDLDQQKVKSRMLKGTVFFEWFADFIIENMVREGIAR